ncbi:MAG: chemotaxis protein CheW [Gammaproteobacteria bacterium]|nr:chemotaxis protein CheW [Gammaproteobacteria bacterium]
MLHAVDNQTSAGRQAVQNQKIMSIRIDQAEFLIDQDEVMTFESIPELDGRNKPKHSLGTFKVNGQDTPVFCLSDGLELLDHIPEDRETCVVLRKDKRMIGLICSEYKPLEYIMFKIQNLPECMSHNKTPISALCIYQLKDGVPVIGKMLTADVIDTYIRLY